MSRVTATFEIDSRSDAQAVERMMENMYDAVREEVRTTRPESIGSSDLLDQFEALRESTRRRSLGRLTVVYERHGGETDA